MSARSASEAAYVPSPEAAVPERIELKARDRRLCVRWPDGFEAALSAVTLRNACRCAACAHLRRAGTHVQFDPDIAVDGVVEFGVAGLQLLFSDGHRRGVFPWQYLRQLAQRAA